LAVIPTVAAVGDNCIDRYLPPVDRDLVGGNALNVAAGLARRGRSVMYAGAVGNDADGRAVLAGALEQGVDIEHVDVVNEQTGVTTVRLGPGGEREFVSEVLGSSAGFVPSTRTLRSLAACGWVHGATLGENTAWLAALAASEVRTSYDFSHPHRESVIEALAPHLDVAFLSLPGAGPEAGMRLARAVCEGGAETVIVTLGAAGCVGVTGDSAIHQAAPDVDAIDTLGAGDAFIAGAVDALLADADLAEAMVAGTADAAEVCRHIGAWLPPEPIYDQEVTT
jgi:fructoselysine 6-kinase